MITDNQCNTVYFSGLLAEEKKQVYNDLLAVLDKYGVPHRLLPETKDIWCRDYMPVQVSKDKFVRFLFNPDYLATQQDYVTDSRSVCEGIGIKVTDSPLVVDGGNVVSCGDKVVMVDKVFDENPQYTVRQLSSMLEETFQAELIFLPWDVSEPFGHIDGQLRYIGNESVLLTADDEEFLKRIEKRLHHHFKEIYTLHYDVAKPSEGNWAYINWLQTDKVLVLPKLGIEEDEQALVQIGHLFPDYKGRIEQLNANALVEDGGAFNCVTWTLSV